MAEMVIVNKAEMHIYDFMQPNETVQEAVQRAEQAYAQELETVKSNVKNYGGEYWESRLEAVSKVVEAGCEAMTYEQFKEKEREHILSGEPVEITAEQFNDMLNVLPPIRYENSSSFEQFCMSEMLTGTYTSQYTHDKKNDKYYTKTVDCMDKSTWIDHYLMEQAEKEPVRTEEKTDKKKSKTQIEYGD